ncbi:phosphotransferase enzyme family protein [Paenibacillus alvei]|uniref:phosphotransferase enzyme family protein n=1 Tax=Paenibacillus alvei TaxID=44250 RepID=UPI0018CDEBC5|nr:phosphotransferase [Paenibacillus alvei]MCY9578156.1 phosphotransferase [Paenibacillus alvei]MCY9586634.1 phosphotransferase [Paenibacillus alvei]
MMMQEEVLLEVCDYIGCDRSELRQIGGYFHSVFEAAIVGSSPVIVKVYEYGTHHAERIQSEVEWVQYLHERGISVAPPVLLRGQLVHSLPTHFFTIYEKALGQPIHHQNEQLWNERFFKDWGAALAQLHTAAEAYEGPSLIRPHWHEHELYKKEDLQVDPIVLAKWKECCRWMSEQPVTPAEYGLIHGDLHQNNLLVERNCPVIIDFGDSEYHWYAYDVAIAIYHAVSTVQAPEERRNFAEQFYHALMEGYSRFRSTNLITPRLNDFIDFRHVYSYIYHCTYADFSKLTDKQTHFLNDMRQSIGEHKNYLGFILV